jgi:signal transduction histidine kinase
MEVKRITKRYLDADPRRMLLAAAALTGAILLADFAITGLSLGFLYIAPILIASAFLRRWEIVIVAAICAVLREAFYSPAYFQFAPEAPGRGLRAFLGFAGAGLLIGELTRNRRLMEQHVRELEAQISLRKEAEEQLSVLINTSPAAILITNSIGTVLMANRSADELFEFPVGGLIGQSIHPLLPAIETVPSVEGSRPLQTNLECRGQRKNGAVFLAQVWFSTYSTPTGPRMALIVLDASEGLRDREGAGLSSLKRTSRVLIGAVSHSVRNLCAASKLSYANLSRRAELRDDEDLKALGTLIRALESIATVDLERAAEHAATSVDLQTLLDELRVVIEPEFQEEGIELEWSVPDILPPVTGEHYGLLHAMLNLTQNSVRALSASANRRFSIGVRNGGSGVEIAFVDTAGGVAQPDLLFRPFASGAAGTGLGLYVARAIIRSFDGDLSYEHVSGGSCFRISLRTTYNRKAYAASDRA